MNKNYIVKKYNITNLILVISLIKPVGIDSISPSINLIWNFMKLIAMVIISSQGIWYYFHKKIKINSFIFYISCMQIFSIISCIFNIQSPYNCIIYWQTILSMIILVDIQHKKNRISEFIKIYFNVLFVMIVINLISIIMYPDGINGRRMFFLGIDNMLILYIFPFMQFIILRNYVYNVKKYSLINIISLFISIITIIYSESATSIIAGVLFISYYIFVYKKNFLSGIFNKITAKKYIILIFLFFVLVIGYQIQDKFSYIIVDLLGKDITFTGRTKIWKRVFELLNQNAFGYGWNSTIPGVEVILDRGRSTFSPGHAHNYFLDLFYKSGIQTLIIFVMFLFSISKKMDKLKMKKERMQEIIFLKFCLFLNLLTLSFEAYPTNFINIYVIFYFMYILGKI